MALTEYRYTVASDNLFPNKKVDLPAFESQIRASAILTALDSVVVAAGDCVVTMKDALSAGDLLILDGLVLAHSGAPLPTAPAPTTSDKRPIVAMSKPDSSKKTIITHDWTDPTTWAECAVRVLDEVAADMGAQTVYSLAHPNVIDTYHGKLSQEDYLLSSAGNSYRVAVKVNAVSKTEQDPHFGTGGDFTVDYSLGRVTFLAALQPADVVTVTYHYATSSAFTVKPEAGKALKLEFAEVQFSDDVVLTDSVVFQPYGLVDVFAPQLMPGVPSGTKIPLGNPVVYKAMSDFQNDAVKSYPVYPVLGGSGWRGSQRPVIVFDWDYLSSTVLRSDYGLEIRVSLQHDAPFSGYYATATFYATTEAL